MTHSLLSLIIVALTSIFCGTSIAVAQTNNTEDRRSDIGAGTGTESGVTAATPTGAEVTPASAPSGTGTEPLSGVDNNTVSNGNSSMDNTKNARTQGYGWLGLLGLFGLMGLSGKGRAAPANTGNRV